MAAGDSNAMKKCYENYILIDTGTNLTNKKFGRDLESVVKRATDAGVRKMVVSGNSMKSSREALRLAHIYPGTLYSTAGVHPHDAKSWTDDTLAELREVATCSECVAVGECGLDYNRDFSTPDVQQEVFELQDGFVLPCCFDYCLIVAETTLQVIRKIKMRLLKVNP
uniref:Deoxyribonuclease TATDN1 n=1 Tax=Graphocephala atropunctata TaxID=36148 RepID=A0A1B6MNI3_9HEMI